MLIEIASNLELVGLRLKVARQDYQEWKMAKDMKAKVHIDYTDYKRLLLLVGECATILEKSVPVIDDMDLLEDFDSNETLPMLDYNNQLSNQAFVELEQALFGSRNGN